MVIRGRRLIAGAVTALALALLALLCTEQSSASLGTAAATAVSASCGQTAAFSHRNSGVRYLSSAETSTVKALCREATVSASKARYIQNHRWLIAPRYKFWWNVPGKARRQIVRKSRAILRKSQAALISLNRRIEHLHEQAIMAYEGYVPPSEARSLGQQMAATWGWTSQNGQWQCLDQLWGKYESSWNMHADNPHSDAYGIPQALPGSKMGARWMTSVWVQIKWGLGYVKDRYFTPCGALNTRLSQGSY